MPYLKKPLHIFIALLSFLIFTPLSYAEEPTKVDDNLIYKLGSGDKLKITFFDEDDLSGEFEVDGSGTLSLPLIGNIDVLGLSLREVEKILISKFKEGYLVNPRISIEILNFRPFFIIGEVNDPGSYPYVSGLTVVNAVALAGGYTHRAKTDKVIITRDKKKIEAKDSSAVLPGDSIRVKERFF
ncbi:MAG: polysaccharide export protein [Proteobacteria bacterium]|nr:polysaccharide export protein [Pseudomonadota bacterium]